MGNRNGKTFKIFVGKITHLGERGNERKILKGILVKYVARV
jgi:hypothetical protein